MAGQRIIDLDAVAPQSIGIKLGGEVYELPGDLPVPKYLRIAALTDELADAGEDAGGTLQRLYDEVVGLFLELNDLPEDAEGNPELPLGPTRLGALVVQLYTQAAEDDAPKRPTKRPAGTRSTSRTKRKTSRSSK